MSIAVREIERADPTTIAALAAEGVATVHEALGGGLLASYMRPIIEGLRIGGSAVTVSVPPGDNLTIHVAVELCREGDILVVAPTAPCDAGYVGDLLCQSMAQRGVRAAVLDTGVRDIRDLRAMGFPVWSRAVSAQGTVKETLGAVNLPVVCAGAVISAGDVIVADDDGVVAVPRAEAEAVLARARARSAKEEALRGRLAEGQLTLDLLDLRVKVAAKGLVYR
jgi:4-hydroxy-4-methyl-2-oxoglutarate aldolase